MITENKIKNKFDEINYKNANINKEKVIILPNKNSKENSINITTEWTTNEVIVLTMAIKLYPSGTENKWDKIYEYCNTKNVLKDLKMIRNKYTEIKNNLVLFKNIDNINNRNNNDSKSSKNNNYQNITNNNECNMSSNNENKKNIICDPLSWSIKQHKQLMNAIKL